MKPFKARVWANPETNQSHYGREFIGTVEFENDSLIQGKKENGVEFNCLKKFWRYQEILVTVDFTKSDLKDGMVVKIRDGNFYLVVGDKLIGKYGFNVFSDYDDNLTCKPDSFDIIAVYETTDVYSIYRLFDENQLINIWQRESVEVKRIEKEMRELAEKQEELADQLAQINNNY